VLSLVLLPVAGLATNAEARPTIQQVKQRIEALEHEAEKATERYNATRERLASIKVRIAAAQTRASQQKQRVIRAKRELGLLAAETYKAGDLSGLSLFLGDDPETALAQSGIVTTLSERRAVAIEQLRAEEKRLAQDAADVAAQRKKFDAALASLQADSKLVQARLSAARAELNRLTAAQRAELARASRAAAERSLSRAVGRKVGASVSCAEVGVKAPDARVQKVLEYACAQLGKPYKWGADGPDSFDCSGLTQKAWAAAGVSLPHNSAMQSRYGTRVPASQLRAGDLVFFHSPISHIAIYLTDGLMLEAPNSGNNVRIAPMEGRGFTGAVRL
jgi:cell wall-associated NlpC family hydrolase